MDSHPQYIFSVPPVQSEHILAQLRSQLRATTNMEFGECPSGFGPRPPGHPLRSPEVRLLAPVFTKVLAHSALKLSAQLRRCSDDRGQLVPDGLKFAVSGFVAPEVRLPALAHRARASFKRASLRGLSPRSTS